MRAHRLLQPTRSPDRRQRPRAIPVRRPDELWHMDMTKVWTAQHGWVYLHVIVDCSTREIPRLAPRRAHPRRRSARLARGRRDRPGRPTRRAHPRHRQRLAVHREDFREHLSARGVTHRRAAATATQSPRRSSSPGSASSRSGAPGAPSGRPSTRRGTRSPTTSTPTTTGPTPGWPTGPPPRSPRPGGTDWTSNRSDLNRQPRRGSRQHASGERQTTACRSVAGVAGWMTACARSSTWSLVRMLLTWFRTVFSAAPSSRAIVVLVSPLATSSSTCRSRSVSSGNGSTAGSARLVKLVSTRSAIDGPKIASPRATASIASADALLTRTLEQIAASASNDRGEDTVVVLEHREHEDGGARDTMRRAGGSHRLR